MGGVRLPSISVALPGGRQPRATAAPARLVQEVRFCRSQWSAGSKSAQLWLHSRGPQRGRGGRAGSRAQPRTRDSNSGSAADFRQVPAPPPGSLSLPICKTEPPKLSPEDPGGRVRDSTYRRISCLVRNVKSCKAERDGGSAGRPEAAPALPPAPGPRSRAQASAPAPRGPASRAPGTRPAAPWTGGCRSPPSPRLAHSSANSSRDAGNFLTSALGSRHRPVPAATAPGATAPRPTPSLKRPDAPSRVPPPAPGSGRSLVSWRRGPGRGRTLRGGAQAEGPASRVGGAGHAACVRADCACVDVALALEGAWGSPRRRSSSPAVDGSHRRGLVRTAGTSLEPGWPENSEWPEAVGCPSAQGLLFHPDVTTWHSPHALQSPCHLSRNNHNLAAY